MSNQHKSMEFSIIVIPDTQTITRSHPDKLMNLTTWVAEQASSLNARMVLHLGDVVNNGGGYESQYQTAKEALDLIDKAGIPMLITPGNHDYDNEIGVDRSTKVFNRYFGMARYAGKDWFGGTFEPNQCENSYAVLEAGGRKLIFISLEFGPRDEVLAWADQLLETHADHLAVLMTHCYMYMHGERTKPGDAHNPKVYKGAIGANDGEDMWRKSFRKHPNLVAVFSGHHVSENISYRMDQGDQGNLVFQSFQNWQFAENGGEGRIRIVTFNLADNLVKLQVFNPAAGEYESRDGYELSFPLQADSSQVNACMAVRYPN